MFMLFGIFVNNKTTLVEIKKVSLVKILNILDLVNTTIEKIMTILVPGWSRADYLLEYSINSNIVLFLYSLGIL